MSSDMPHSKNVQPAVNALNNMAASMNDSAAEAISAADAFIAELRKVTQLAVDECQKSRV